jgi:DNA-binding NarL/FixJ family response regulator
LSAIKHEDCCKIDIGGDAHKMISMLGDKRKRILLVDDHALVRQGLERLLNLGDEFVVCEEAGTAAEGIELVRELRPDAVIVDVGLPGGTNGIQLTRKLRDQFPNVVVLILSAHDEPKYVRGAAEAGAMGYVLKNEAIENLRIALRRAFTGRRTFDQNLLGEED